MWTSTRKFLLTILLAACAMLLTQASPCFCQGVWWQAPQLKYVEEMPEEAHGTSPHYWTFSGPSLTDSTNDQTYLYTQDSNMNENFSQYVVAELRAANTADEVTYRWAVDHIGRPKGCTQYGNRLVIGNGGEENQPFTGYPDDFTIGDRPETLLEADISPDCDTLHFNHDGTLLYTDHYSSATGSRHTLHRYQVTGSLDEDGQAFTRDVAWQDNGTFSSSVARLRNFCVKYIGGKDLIYYGEGDTTALLPSVYVLDPETGEETLLVDEVFASGEGEDQDIVNVKIAGVASGDLHLYVMGNIAGLKIYKLAEDGLSVENDGEPVAYITTDQLNEITNSEAFSSHCRAFEVTDDQEYAFFSSHDANANIFVIYAEPGSSVNDWLERQ